MLQGVQGNSENIDFWPKTILKTSKKDQIEVVGPKYFNVLYEGAGRGQEKYGAECAGRNGEY